MNSESHSQGSQLTAVWLIWEPNTATSQDWTIESKKAVGWRLRVRIASSL